MSEASPRYPHQIIRASAGSGKTYRLTTAYLSLLQRGAMPETILATTFTRKAAGEILGRVLLRLARAASDDVIAGQLGRDMGVKLTMVEGRQILARLCASLHRVTICTIDSFFNRIVNSFRLELDVPPQTTIVAETDPLAVQLRLRAIDAVLGDADMDVMLDLLRRLHHDSATRSVTQSIDDIVSNLYNAYREANDEAAWTALRIPAGELDAKQLAQAINALTQLAEHLPRTKQGQPNKNWLKSHAETRDAALRRDWDLFIKAGLVSKIIAGEDKYDRVEISGTFLDVYSPLIQHACASLVAQIARQTHATYDLLKRFDQHFTRLRRQQGLMLFSDLPYKLARELPALGDDVVSDVYYRLDTRVTHVLLDEFQDTSIDQWTVLRPIAQEVASDVTGDRTFLCVGDVKQAIYQWRGGCAEIFDHIERELHLPDEARQSMARSYRSSPIVLDAVNRVFINIADNPVLAEYAQVAQGWQQGFETHEAHQTYLPGFVKLVSSPPPVDTTKNDDDDNNEDDNDRNENSTIAQAVNPHESFVVDYLQTIVQAARGYSVGVLVRRNKTVNRMIYLLRQRGMHVSGEGGNPIIDDAAVNLILSAMMLADHPGHTAAAFHLLHSPLASVLAINDLLPAHLDETALNIRALLLTHGYGPTIAQWSRKLAPHCNARSVARLTQLVELADRYDPALTLRPGDFVRYINAASVEEPTPARVRVMTIHRSKGLEFDVVVLPELNQGLLRHMNRTAVNVVRSHGLGPVTAVYRQSNKLVRSLSPELDEAHRAGQERELRDDLSTLYVAMTRARFALHMIVQSKRPLSSGNAPGPSLNYACMLGAALANEPQPPLESRVLYESGNGDWFTHAAQPATTTIASPDEEPLTIKLASEDEAPHRHWRLIAPSSLKPVSHVPVHELLELTRSQAQLRGSILHAMFEQIDWLDDTGVDRDILLRAVRQAHPKFSREQMLEQWPAFEQMLRQPGVRKVFARPRDGDVQLWRERPFAVQDGANLVTGVLDRVVIHRDHHQITRAQVIDFKTDRVTANNPDELVQRYTPQLRAYRAAVANMLRVPTSHVTTALLLVTIGELCEVD